MPWSDPTLDHLESLQPACAQRALELVNAAREAGWPVWISSSIRSEAEQRALVAAGRSRTMSSKHITGLAFDVDVLGLRRDDVPMPFLRALGAYGEALGLRWGGRWTRPFDPGHFEL